MGNAARSKKRPKKRSAAQQSVSKTYFSSPNKENSPPAPSAASDTTRTTLSPSRASLLSSSGAASPRVAVTNLSTCRKAPPRSKAQPAPNSLSNKLANVKAQLQKRTQDLQNVRRRESTLKGQLEAQQAKSTQLEAALDAERDSRASADAQYAQLDAQQKSEIAAMSRKISLQVRLMSHSRVIGDRRRKQLERLKTSMQKLKGSSSGDRSQVLRKGRRHGLISNKTRALVRKMVVLGIPSSKVPQIIKIFANDWQIKLGGDIPSERSVRRALVEGLVGAKMQLGAEMTTTKSITVSGDATTHSGINKQAYHIVLDGRPNSQSTDPSSPSTSPHPSPKVHRTLGVQSTIGHTAEEQLANLQTSFEDVVDTAARAPRIGAWFDLALAKAKTLADLQAIARKLTGLNTDHAEDQKKLARLIEAWKRKQWRAYLGRCEYERWSDEQRATFRRETGMVAAAGLQDWNSLSSAEQIRRMGVAEEEAFEVLGDSVYASCSEEERRSMDLFVWAGCGMHKDLNAVRGGNAAMMAMWDDSATKPCELPNKDNDATLTAAREEGTTSSKAAERAAKVTQRGAVKACSVAGAILNHKDDKKGYQEQHVDWFAVFEGVMRRFPDTSNTRYGSYIAAAIMLFCKRETFLKLLENMRNHKASGQFNHMELNLDRALRDSPTIIELAVLSLYGQAISRPYMAAIRAAEARNTNMLTMGPLHSAVITHLETLIANPDLLLGADANPKTGALNGGEEWHDPEVFSVLREMAKDMDQVLLRAALDAFLKGALTTWKRFTSEFDSDGLIASLSPEEVHLAFLPCTNDINEGALGTYRLWLRRFPTMTEATYNAVRMIRVNGTEEFMEEFFGEEHYAFMRGEGRRLVASGQEKANRKRRVEAKLASAKENLEKRQAAAEKVAERKRELDKVVLELDEEVIRKMKGKEIALQVGKHRFLSRKDPALACAPGYPRWSHQKTVKDQAEYLVQVVARHKEWMAANPGINIGGEAMDWTPQVEVNGEWWDDEELSEL